MLLLLMRHGIAAEDEQDDARRPLTEKGRERVRDMADLVVKLGVSPDYFLHSPRRRALETAEVALERMGAPAEALREFTSLDFDGSWEDFVAQVAELTAGNDEAVVLAVGHEPNIGRFITEALTHSPSGFHIKKGAVAAMSWRGPIANDGAELRFYLTYSMAKRL